MSIEPLGFPSCANCPYLRTGTPRICAACASATTEGVPTNHCPICSQAVPEGSTCRNRLCTWPLDSRAFSRVDAVAMYSGTFAAKLRDFKYSGARGWGLIFGRLVLGWLARATPNVDLVVGNPTAQNRQPYQHVEQILQAAQVEDVARSWPFAREDQPLWIKPHDTAKSAGNAWQAKMDAAEAHANAIVVLRPDQIRAARILLIDDIFTTGAQFHTVARLLRRHGAADVRGLVLARAPWVG